jgi:hypothetical protein
VSVAYALTYHIVGIAKEGRNLPSQGNLAIAMSMEKERPRTISQLVGEIV